MRKGQSSVEFLVIVAFSLIMLVPATLIFLNYSSDSQSAVLNSQVYQAANEIALTSELIYGVGTGSWQTIELLIPETVTSLVVYPSVSAPTEIVMKYGDPSSTVVLFADVPIWNSSTTVNCPNGCNIPIHEGLNRIRVESREVPSSYPVIELTVLS